MLLNCKLSYQKKKIDNKVKQYSRLLIVGVVSSVRRLHLFHTDAALSHIHSFLLQVPALYFAFIPANVVTSSRKKYGLNRRALGIISISFTVLHESIVVML